MTVDFTSKAKNID